MNRRGFIVKTGLMAGNLGLLSYAIAQVINLNEAINKSGRQRMLSQRMAKAYLQLGLGIEVEQSRKILESSLNSFERQHAELKNFAPTQDNKQLLSEMEKNWQQYKKVLLDKQPNQQDARAIMVLNEDVLSIAHKATMQLEAYSGTSMGQLVNVSGRQRMLSQRMAKFYQAQQWGVAPPDVMAKLDAARKDFVAGMTTLQGAPANTARIREELALAQQQWLFFDDALGKIADTRNARQYAINVATTSERILSTMDGITSLYQQLA
ncbi:type IV pili methyl-accepting chemotaxis transducer N-terminal domain-containing protein [Undibacterium sp. TS12]|uniref:type IV pili methyl-accepting chemotaxis transducer N-terminal domain-containing protein n=1 Tax=Undibacterium sp. TS12 TaxID=2908202 RepID=UPI001F4C730B|nr:type IV pili methyl-accepting chemotaxis transducer N-terminal domain-containing protein [Undibacterium sp. TS12]MCH8622905.1 type IV pili methyl-accepting chemotaxis transducer N-terminal domain-containing protein [Undibacterium sp. TS12]